MASEVFTEYYKKIKKESLLKSFLCSLTIGFSVLFICAISSWLSGFITGIYIGLLLFIITMTISTLIFYKHKFYPTTKKIAQRVDVLGLEERILTMTELEHDNSYIAMKQREDALNAIKSVNSKMLKIAVSLPLIIAVAVSATFGTGMTVVAAVNPNSGKEFIDSFREKKTYEITYAVEGKGWVINFSKTENSALISATKEREKQREKDIINGKEVTYDEDIPYTFKSRLGISYTAINEDTNATIILDGSNYKDVEYSIKVAEGDEFDRTLMALPQKGYVFVGWSDGVESPYREDKNITENKTITAVFDEVENVKEQENQNSEEEDKAGDSNSNVGSSNSNSGSGNDGNSGSSDENKNGAKESPSNQVVDGKTYYGDIFEDAYREMVERVKNSSSLTEAEKKAISDYFDSIRKS